VLLLGYLWISKKNFLKFTKQQWLLLSLLAVFSIYLTNAFEFWGLQHLTAAKTCFIYSLSPFFAALFSYLFFQEKINGRKWIGMAIGFLGFIPMLAVQKGSEELLTTIPFLSWPELSLVGASVCTALGWIILRMVVSPPKKETGQIASTPISPLVANGISMGIGGMIALVHSFLIDPWNPLPVATSSVPIFLQNVLCMALISNVLCYNLYGFLLKRFTATFLSFMGLFSPIFASLNSWFFLGETPSVLLFICTAVISLGLWMIYSAELRQGYIVRGQVVTDPSLPEPIRSSDIKPQDR
jgi:drug/metabolite transporter (DMT)-like permease